MLRLFRTLTAVALLGTTIGAPLAPGAAAAPRDTPRLHTWDSGAEWETGSLQGLQRKGGRLVVARQAPIRTIGGIRQRVGTWTAPWTRGPLVDLTPSWQAYTGRGDLKVSVRTRSASGKSGAWDTVVSWTSVAPARRSTRLGASDGIGQVVNGSWVADDPARPAMAWQVRVRLTDPVGGYSISNLYRMDVVTRSALPVPASPSTPGVAAGRKPLPAPSYSIADEAGGASWATAAAFVMALEGTGTSISGNDGPVAYAAVRSIDRRTGSSDLFAFLTAFTSSDGLASSWVTRFTGLAELERELVERHYPVVPLSGGARPVLVTGIEADGDVIVRDPSAPSKAEVDQVIDRASFESDWLESEGLAGIVTRRIIR